MIHLLLGKRAAIGRAIEEREAKKAKERKKADKNTDGIAGGRGKKMSKPSSESDDGLSAPETGRTDEKVAEAVGMGKDTYRKAKAVVEAADRGRLARR